MKTVGRGGQRTGKPKDQHLEVDRTGGVGWSWGTVHEVERALKGVKGTWVQKGDTLVLHLDYSRG